MFGFGNAPMQVPWLLRNGSRHKAWGSDVSERINPFPRISLAVTFPAPAHLRICQQAAMTCIAWDSGQSGAKLVSP